ncbi:hypothetical protein LCI18_011662 [Fusarium solani-melongenae]|uniref:Uncharacterized protein n=1 Tax=Fusarium solani subsp. cucurbitae TaxID=2747967 RepID=A0ACD3ZHM1_FUSSC|nr:hypothetical protein LCI18_011662 [Fusarium solani-melongenae]
MERSNFNHVGSMAAAGSARIQIGNNSTINNTTNNYSQDDDEKYLAALSSTDPRQDKSRIEQTNGDLLKEAYLWVLQNPEFQRWRETSESQPLLWIRGDPGKGKTMLLSGIINELQPSTRLKDPTRQTDPRSQTSLSYFFCQATNPGLNNATAVLRGLVYLLVDQHPNLLSHVRGKLPLDPGHWNLGVAIRAIFLEMLQDESLQNVILIVDGLDECETDMRFLLEVITATMSHEVRWLVSSRNIRMIETILTQAQTKVVLSLELNAQSVGQAISEYIQHRMGRLGSRINLDDDELRSTSSYLYKNAHGTFLWVALWEVQDLLERPPQGLNELYERMMQRVRHSISANLYLGILSFIFTAYRPITFSELVIIKDLPRSEAILPNMIMECGGFLTSRDGVIYLVHQSAKDFLAKQQDILFPSGLTRHHLGLFDACLNSLDVLRMDIYDQVYPGVSAQKARRCRPEPDPLPGLSYSPELWAHHLHDAQPIHSQEISNYNKAHQFIAHKFLFWLEALSLLNSLPVAMETLQILKDLPLIRLHPLMDLPSFIYASGLIFSPEESLIRRHFEHCSPKFVVKKPRVGAQWHPYFSTSEWACDLIFSPDNKSMVRTSFSGVTKWNVGDGMEIKSAEYDWLDFITPSPDLNLFADGALVAIFHDNYGLLAQLSHPGPSSNYNKEHTEDKFKTSANIVILDVRTGEQRRNPPNEAIGSIRSIIFIPNTYEIMMCCENGVWSWDIVKGGCQEWPGFGDLIWDIASSHDASWIAAVSGSRVFVYGRQNQELLQHFQIPSGYIISSIAVSFDDQQLAVHSGESVWLYDTPSSLSKQTHFDRVAVLKVFISDNRRLMAWALERKIQVLDATTGIHLCEFDMPWFWDAQSLEPWSGRNLAAFSSGSHMLAARSSSSRSSSLLSAWDLTDQRLLHEIEVPDLIRRLAVSHNGNNHGRWVAAITAQNICVWNATTMRLRWSLEHTFERADYKGPIALQFSDCKLAVLWSLRDDYSLIYYNVTDGTRLTHVKLPSPSWARLAEGGFSISPSGRRATLGSRGGKLRIISISQDDGVIRRALLSMGGSHMLHVSFLDDSTLLTDQGMLDIDAILAEAAIEPNTPHTPVKGTGISHFAWIGYGVVMTTTGLH